MNKITILFFSWVNLVFVYAQSENVTPKYPHFRKVVMKYSCTDKKSCNKAQDYLNFSSFVREIRSNKEYKEIIDKFNQNEAEAVQEYNCVLKDYDKNIVELEKNIKKKNESQIGTKILFGCGSLVSVVATFYYAWPFLMIVVPLDFAITKKFLDGTETASLKVMQQIKDALEPKPVKE